MNITNGFTVVTGIVTFPGSSTKISKVNPLLIGLILMNFNRSGIFCFVAKDGMFFGRQCNDEQSCVFLTTHRGTDSRKAGQKSKT